jgi:Tat protein secretion system quality control protein TatD with DNase activity
MTTAHIIHGLKRIAYDHPCCAATCQAAVERLERLEAEHGRLRRAAEIGLEYAKGDLAQRKESFAGYPTCWIEQQRDVAFIEDAMRGEVQP